MNTITKNIQKLAGAALEAASVDMVLGFKQGSVPMASAPCIVRDTEQVGQLIWDSNCGLNLANYLTDRTKMAQRDKDKKICIIAKGCDTRNIVTHMVENRVTRDQLHIIGVPCTGMVDRPRIESRIKEPILDYAEQDDTLVITTAQGTQTLEKQEFLRANCATCMHPNPVIYDQLAADLVEDPEIDNPFEDVDEIQALDQEARWQYFDDLLGECIRCYACRNACPLCYCPTCFVDESAPQWVGKGSNSTDIKTFHFLRAYHCAGRCTDCGACVQACPMDIDVRAFTRKLVKDSLEIYGWEPGLDPEKRPPLDTFNPDDSDRFIV